MRDIVFYLADESMEKGLRAFFRRANWHHAMGCGRFGIDPENQRDIFRVAGYTDGGVWRHAHTHLATHRPDYARAVVILDEFFEGSPGAQALQREIAANLILSGWSKDSIEVIAIQPMLEAWLWADNINVARAFGFSDFDSLQKPLIERGYWEPGQPKPREEHLKDAKNVALHMGGKKRLKSSPFAKLFEQISQKALGACHEPGFQRMRTRLRKWFPPEGVA